MVRGCLAFIGMMALCYAQNHASVLPDNVAHAKNKSPLKQSVTLTNGPDSAKIKGITKTVSDVDIDDVVALNFLNNNRIHDLRKIFETDKMLSAGLLFGRLMVIFSIFLVVLKAINRFTIKVVNAIILRTHRRREHADAQVFANTAGPILNSILRWILIAITTLIVLTEIGVDIMPIIYSFGVLGLAISIGAQTLVRDIISGVLTLFEGVVAVGETVELNGQIGTIEAMSLRAIEFRHVSGKMQVVSFSEINSLFNLSRGYSQCNLVLPVGHEANLLDVEGAYRDVLKSLQDEPKWNCYIKEDLKLSGVLSITETAVYLSCSVRTIPDPDDLFGKEFRKRLHAQIVKRKIPLPHPANISVREVRF